MSEYKPVITVVLPTYQRPLLLRRAIDSVLNQTAQGFELIVVDDANDKQVADVVQAYGDARISLIQHKQCQGVSVARNSGIKAATADLVCFLDDDDELMPDYLAVAINTMNASAAAGFLWCGIIRAFEDPHGEIVNEKISYLNDIASQPYGFVLRIGTGCGLCCRKSVLDQLDGFDPDFRLSEDRDLVLRMLAKGYGYMHVNQVLYKRYYHYEDSLTNNATAQVNVEYDLKLLERHQGFINRHYFLKVRLLDLVARYYYIAGEFDKAIDFAFRAWRVRPFRVKGIRRLLRYNFMRLLKH